MDTRPFTIRAASAVAGCVFVALGSLIVPVAGIGCMLFVAETSAAHPSYLDDDSALAGLLFSLVTALTYGVFGAPYLWRRRPMQFVEPDIRRDAAPSQYDNGHPFAALAWNSPVARYGPAAEDRGVPGPFWEQPPQPQPDRVSLKPLPMIAITGGDDPVIEMGPPVEVDLDEIAALEREADAVEAPTPPTPTTYEDVGVPTLIGIPVAAKIAASDEYDEEAWFTS